MFKRNSGNYQARQKLSPREKEVLELISEGASFQEMVEKLGINSKTLYTHRRNLVMKLGCDNRVSLLNLVLQRQV
ncbi:response regulator transcription factor [Escherichia coli]